MFIIFIIYLLFLCICSMFYWPLIIGLAFNGINGLKDEFNSLLTDKNYYLQVAKPVFIFFSCIYIICILCVLFALLIAKII